MDNLHLPFDKEAVWKGIDQRKKKGWKRSVLLLFPACICLLTAIGLSSKFLQTPEFGMAPEKTSHTPIGNDLFKNDSVFSPSKSKIQNLPIEEGLPSGILYNPNLKQTNASTQKNSFQTKAQTETRIELGLENSNFVKTGESNSPISIVSDSDTRIVANLKKLPFLPIFLPFEGSSPQTSAGVSSKELLTEIKPVRSKASGRLFVEAGIGKHHAQFSPAEPSQNNYRDLLEKSQFDYRLCISYEHVLPKDFYLSTSLGYTLFKDRINTKISKIDSSASNVLKSQNIDFNLHNHYHQIFAEIGIGRQFEKHRFFGDLGMALGGSYLVQVEGHHFNGSEFELLNSEPDSYTGNTSLYWKGKAGCGVYLGRNSILKTGFQFRTPVSLTTEMEAWKHTIFAGDWYLGFGFVF